MKFRWLAMLVMLQLASAALAADADWRAYGANAGGTRYSPAADINRDNVSRLQVAWTYHTGDFGEGYSDAHDVSFEATPLLVDGILYISTPTGKIHALDPATGKRIWMFDPELPKDSNYSEHTSRGVSFWEDPDAPRGAACKRRIFFGTRDARMIALDARTGKLCDGFGNEGVVDLNKGSRPKHKGGYLITSPPAIWHNLVITGSAVADNDAVDMELGIVRALDARTGRVVWGWDPIPRDPADPQHGQWRPDQVEKTGAANAWSVLSVDPERGLVFVPTGSASPDFYGGERLGSNRNANSVVALDAATGKLVWAQQLIHHDLLDYDMPAQPVLADVRRDGKTIPVVLEITKMGMLFAFDRRDGTPIFPIEERKVPASTVPGEQPWPTQPFSTLPALSPQGPVTEDDAWGLTPIDRWDCKRQIRKYRSQGIYTPPSRQGTIERPSWAGGGNWGSLAFDSSRQLAITNVMTIAGVVQLIPRADFMKIARSGEFPDSEFTAQFGTPFGMRRQLLLSFLGVPCTAPPWGKLVAVNLATGRIAWQVPLGTTEDMAPWPFKDIQGVPNIGGPMVTAGGLVFIGAALDNYLRAFDVETGRELWKGRLPYGGQATPMTYRVGGKQYVVIAAGGHNGVNETGDALVAFALP